MKKIILLLATCFTLAVSAPVSSVIAQDSTTVALPTDTLATSDAQPSALEEAQTEIDRLQRQVEWMEKQRAKSKSVVAITGTVLVFMVPFAVIFCWFYFRSKNKRAKYALIEKMMTSGQPGAAELYRNIIEGDRRQSRNRLLHGIRMAFVGIGLTAFFTVCMGKEMGSIGILVFFIGIGEAIAGYLQKREEQLRMKKIPEQQARTSTEEIQNPTPEEK